MCKYTRQRKVMKYMGLICEVDIGETGNADIKIHLEIKRTTQNEQTTDADSLSPKEKAERERKAFERSKRRTKKIVMDNFYADDYVLTETFPIGISDEYRKKIHDNRIERLAYYCEVNGIELKYVTVWGHSLTDEDKKEMFGKMYSINDSHGWGHHYGDNDYSLHCHSLVPDKIRFDELLRIFDDGIGNADIQRANELCKHIDDPKDTLDRTVEYFYKNYAELTDEDKKIVGERRVHCSKNMTKRNVKITKADRETRPNEFDIAAEEDNVDGEVKIKGQPTEIAHDIIKAYNNGFGEFEELDKAVKKHITGINLDRYQYEYHWNIIQNEYGTYIHLSATKIGSEIELRKRNYNESECVIEQPKSKLEQALDAMIVSPLLRPKDVLIKRKHQPIKDRLGIYMHKVQVNHELVLPTWKAFKKALGLPSFDSPNSQQRKAFEDRFFSLISDNKNRRQTQVQGSSLAPRRA